MRSRLRSIAFFVLSVISVGGAHAIEGLEAQGPYPPLAQELMLFGRLVGDWDVAVESRQDDGTWIKSEAVWRFGWVLGGRAIQDLWISFKPGARRDDPEGVQTYGTTIRVYDPAERVWHVNWIGVSNQTYVRLRARPVGEEIVMDAQVADARPTQWIFSAISKDRFLWRSQESSDRGKSWSVTHRMTAVRRRRE